MMTPTHGSRPCDALPPVRGSITMGAPLKDLVWFRAGGPAEILFRPADAHDLAAFLAAKSAELRILVIGVGSNLLVRDGGIPGVVVRLSSAFGKIETDGLRVRAGAAALDGAVARAACDAGIAGLEFLRGVPGTIGGALKMNAGCYSSEIKDVFVEAVAIDAKGNKIRLSGADMDFAYRKAQGAGDDLIFVEAVFEGRRDEPAAIRARMEELSASREASQPIKSKTGGSTFKNPPGHKAWQLIDAAGCRGLKIGAAQVSEKHTNFLINTGEATASELEALGEEVRRRVKEKSGVMLEWEIKRVGVA
jgi:UDP-N-acetylmuramate dehydrogenase